MHAPFCAVAAVILLTALALLFFFGIDTVRNLVLTKAFPLLYSDLIQEFSEKYDLDVFLVMAVVRCESGFRFDAVSRTGALGLMQIMPDTGEWIAEKLHWSGYSNESLLDPKKNIEAGCWYLRYLCSLFDDDLRLVCAAYNAGQGTVSRWIKDERYFRNGSLTSIPYPETAAYVDRVLSSLKRYRTLYPQLS